MVNENSIDPKDRVAVDQSAADRLDPRIAVYEEEPVMVYVEDLGDNHLTKDELNEQIKIKNEAYKEETDANLEAGASDDAEPVEVEPAPKPKPKPKPEPTPEPEAAPMDPRQAATTRSNLDKNQEAQLSPEAQKALEKAQGKTEKRSLADKILHPTK